MSKSAELQASPDPSPGPSLLSGRLSMGQAVLYGVAAMGVPATLASQGAYVLEAGYSAWLAVVVVSVIAAILATIVVRFTRSYLVSGSLMSYLRLAAGERAGMLGAAALAVGYAGAIVSYLSVTLYFGFAALGGMGVSSISVPAQLVGAGVVLGLCCLLQRRGVSVSVNVSIVLSLLVAPFVVLIMAAAIIENGVDLPSQLSLRGFDLATFVPAVVIAFGTFVAFEGLTALARETKNPTRTMPVVVYVLVGCLAAAALVATALTVPILMGHTEELYSGQSPLRVLAEAGNVAWAGPPADVLLSISMGGALIAYVNDSSRVVATAGQDGYLPRALNRIDPRHHTPAIAAQVMALIAFAMMTAFLILTDQGMYGVTLNFTAFIVYSWSIAYVAIAVTAAVIAWRSRSIATLISCLAVVAFLVPVVGYSVAHATGLGAVFTWIVFGSIALVFVSTLARHRGREVAPVGEEREESPAGAKR